jgi:arylsulfatase A-like enzyme
MLGKYMNEYQPTSGEVPPGWDTWAVSGKGYHGYDYNLNSNGRVMKYGGRPRDYMTDMLKRRGLRFIDDAVDAGDPFFLKLSPFTPHGPATAARRHARRFRGLRAPRPPAFDQAVEGAPSWLAGRRPLSPEQIAVLDQRFRRRAQSVIAVDDALKAIMQRLRSRGQLHRTYVVFTSDNGFHLGEHRLMVGKMTAFDYDVRVPLVVTGPGVPAGRTVDALAQNVDLRPTFADLAGARVRGGADGRSLVPALHGLPLRDWRRFALVEHHGERLLPSDPDWQPAPGGNPTTYTAIRFDGGLYVESRNGEREFYDLERDPHALRNAYRDLEPARQAELARRVARLEGCSGRRACFAAARG